MRRLCAGSLLVALLLGCSGAETQKEQEKEQEQKSSATRVADENAEQKPIEDIETLEVVDVFEDSAASASSRASSPKLVPADFRLPVLVTGDGFKLEPLGPELVEVDYNAYMSSIDHLQKTFSRSKDWPRKGITEAEASLDLLGEQGRFENRESFAFAVLTTDGARERGRIYIQPSDKMGFDAQVRMWVTQDEFDRGFEAELYGWLQDWVSNNWPFSDVAYPGRSIDWAQWDSLPDKKWDSLADKKRDALPDK